MMTGREEWVCLQCFNRWSPRKPPSGKPQCSNKDCKSRLTVETDQLETTVKNIQEVEKGLPAPLGEFLNPPSPGDIPDLFSSSQDLLEQADPRFPTGINVFQSLLRLAHTWDDSEPIKDAIDRMSDSERTE